MADGVKFNFGAQRNEDYQRVWRFRPKGETDGIDVTGWSFSLRFHTAAGLGTSPVLSLSQTPTANGSVVNLDDPTDGKVEIYISRADMALFPGRAVDVIPFAYNLLATDGGGIRRADMRGFFIVEPGV